MTTYLITGANRGLGFEHTKQALAADESVIATCREPEKATELLALSERYPKLRIEQLDLSEHDSIAAIAKRLDGVAIDILFNIAGLFGGGWSNQADRYKQSLTGMDYALWHEIMQANVYGHFELIAALLANVEASTRKTIIMMSSDLGSIANNQLGMAHAYRSSKAALNMLTKGLSIELAPNKITVISLAPGWVKTDLGGDDAPWEVDDSVRHQRNVIANLIPSATGKFIDLLGKSVPW
ncbi:MULTISPECIES: SDR family oxidoreductase [Aliiglaciecola]|uniref:SDR family oxidoreductase n=1 Tax=Aliiglaciecola TaxID=1406885 RepID=UPI001C080829|nr:MULTISPECIES: SDR family oxidoreductase [Aliiglaciecola]MBU2879008.1 SDR family oxidoreductase [Aliiglaciecola lipolytica]MDO6710706.1 SDR family oxidoreductase [Aliiglaciecola sp. 2_MG-2023]MDO6751886.1 SDR family oxidoreductase [Aliiglaciecola sp. 1_MG-2023]